MRKKESERERERVGGREREREGGRERERERERRLFLRTCSSIAAKISALIRALICRREPLDSKVCFKAEEHIEEKGKGEVYQ